MRCLIYHIYRTPKVSFVLCRHDVTGRGFTGHAGAQEGVRRRGRISMRRSGVARNFQDAGVARIDSAHYGASFDIRNDQRAFVRCSWCRLLLVISEQADGTNGRRQATVSASARTMGYSDVARATSSMVHSCPDGACCTSSFFFVREQRRASTITPISLEITMEL